MFIEDLSIGQSVETSNTITQKDIEKFADLSGDHNPVHLDEAYAAGTQFKSIIAHGMLSASFISGILGTSLPGTGAIIMGMTLKFLAPVHPGDTVRTVVTVKEVIAEKRRVICQTACYVGATQVIEGEAMLQVPARTHR